MHLLTCFQGHRSFGLFKAGAWGCWCIPECSSVLTVLPGNNGSCVPSLKRLATMQGSSQCTVAQLPGATMLNPLSLRRDHKDVVQYQISAKQLLLLIVTMLFFYSLDLQQCTFILQDSDSLEEYCYIIPHFSTIGLNGAVYSLL